MNTRIDPSLLSPERTSREDGYSINGRYVGGVALRGSTGGEVKIPPEVDLAVDIFVPTDPVEYGRLSHRLYSPEMYPNTPAKTEAILYPSNPSAIGAEVQRALQVDIGSAVAVGLLRAYSTTRTAPSAAQQAAARLYLINPAGAAEQSYYPPSTPGELYLMGHRHLRQIYAHGMGYDVPMPDPSDFMHLKPGQSRTLGAADRSWLAGDGADAQKAFAQVAPQQVTLVSRAAGRENEAAVKVHAVAGAPVNSFTRIISGRPWGHIVMPDSLPQVNTAPQPADGADDWLNISTGEFRQLVVQPRERRPEDAPTDVLYPADHQ
jgi:hypothetical protein